MLLTINCRLGWVTKVMGKGREKIGSSPARSVSSSSSSEFEFSVGISPRRSSPNLYPADELFYKGQLLPLHYSTRLSVVRNLLASESSSSSSETSRDSTGSSNSLPSELSSLAECESSRPSSVAEDDVRRVALSHSIKKTRTFSFPRFFRKPKEENGSGKRVGDVLRKYLNKVKPFYKKISHKDTPRPLKSESDLGERRKCVKGVGSAWSSSSFSGNLKYPRRRSFVSSCPSSIRSSPSHSGLLSRTGSAAGSSSMDEVHHAIQGAIAYCKNSMSHQNKSRTNEN